MHLNIPDTIVFLAGGKGTRLGALTKDTPKPLLPFLGKPFLAWMCEILKKHGITNFVFSTGYLREQFDSFEREWLPDGCSLEIVEESEPLGTGGAFVNVLENARELPDYFWGANADSIWNAELIPAMWEVHQEEQSAMTILTTERRRPDQAGVVYSGNEIVEWNAQGAPYINAGLYCFSKDFLVGLPSHGSLENDFLPSKIKTEKICGVVDPDNFFLDYGTPEYFEQTEDYLKKFQSVA